MTDTAPLIGGDQAKGKVTHVTLTVHGVRYRFQIRQADFEELERQHITFGPVDLYKRIIDGTATATEIKAVIWAGLAGGHRKIEEEGVAGRSFLTAQKARDKIVAASTFGELVTLAETILAAALVGVGPVEA